MSFRLNFKFKIFNKTNKKLKNIQITDENELLHLDNLSLLEKENFSDLEKVRMHLYKPETVYLNFTDEDNISQKLVLFESIKRNLKLQYEVIIDKDLDNNFFINLA